MHCYVFYETQCIHVCAYQVDTILILMTLSDSEVHTRKRLQNKTENDGLIETRTEKKAVVSGAVEDKVRYRVLVL